jgi:hypothetical protein
MADVSYSEEVVVVNSEFIGKIVETDIKGIRDEIGELKKKLR